MVLETFIKNLSRKVWLKYGQICRRLYVKTYVHLWKYLAELLQKEISNKICGEIQNTRFISNTFCPKIIHNIIRWPNQGRVWALLTVCPFNSKNFYGKRNSASAVQEYPTFGLMIILTALSFLLDRGSMTFLVLLLCFVFILVSYFYLTLFMIVQFAFYSTSANFQISFLSILNSWDRSWHEHSLNVLPTNIPYYINSELFSQLTLIVIF